MFQHYKSYNLSPILKTAHYGNYFEIYGLTGILIGHVILNTPLVGRIIYQSIIPDKESPIPPVAIPSFPDPFINISPFILEVVVRNPFNTVTT